MWNEAIAAYFNIISRLLSGAIAPYNKESQDFGTDTFRK
jgi:hypothetical protein